jgi:hypothetical protein
MRRRVCILSEPYTRYAAQVKVVQLLSPRPLMPGWSQKRGSFSPVYTPDDLTNLILILVCAFEFDNKLAIAASGRGRIAIAADRTE